MGPEIAEREQREKLVYFVRSGTQEELKDYLKKSCDPLLGSSVYVSRDQGDIYYISWPDLPKERILPREYIQISKTGPHADIYAPYTRLETKSMVIKQIKKDGGAVEAAIRAFDYILEGTQQKEERQAQAIQDRAYEILDLFKGRNLTDIKRVEFRRIKRKTYSLLVKNEIHPERLINQIKVRMVEWLLKGEKGKDVTERLNWLISVCALQAAYRAALERRYGLGPIAVKFIEGREALVITRQFCRGIFKDVSNQLRPQAIPSHELFKYPQRAARGHQLGYVSGMLGTVVHQLDRFIPVKPYKQVGKEAAQIIKLAQEALSKGKRQEAKSLLAEAREKLVTQLEKSKYVYPKEKIY